ncbi:MFS transporter [Kitasatospora cineracea]|uniref:EmrB/QacA subfamily drug resistance transporter n=1 Tax=Kitasatospora cineracea TaxID=88074 RepID=A0A8G1U9P7_9ACTN|nr:MFS transporter [Kitasatospora cineracea]ROR35449.1 EmrB/QacA subfamily drug resistance transporter [Kitasatospora cineracea]
MRKWIPLTAICVGAFMLLVDASIVNTALPEMSEDLHSTFTALQWVVDVYALTLAALLMAFGSLGDRLGHRRLYLAGLAVFGLASLVCALAPDAGALIAARAAQGIGGAAMMTSTTALLNTAYQGRDRGTAFGVWGAVNGAAAAAGPVLGGLLTQQLGWRSIFLVNLPIAALAGWLTVRRLTADRPRPATGRPDLPGAAAFTLFAAALTYGLIESGERGWSDPLVLTTLATAALALAAFTTVELRTPRPLLDLRLLRNPAFLGLAAAGLLLTAAAFAPLTYTGLWLQQVLHLSPLDAGLAVCPLAAAAFVTAPAATRLLRGAPPRLPIALGLALIGGGTLLLTLVSPGTGWTALLPGLLLTGVGVGLATPQMMSTALAAVPRERAGMASGAFNTARQLGLALGIAVLGTVFQNTLRDHPAADPRHGYATALDHVYLAAGTAGLLAAALVVLLVRRPAAAATATPETAKERSMQFS